MEYELTRIATVMKIALADQHAACSAIVIAQSHATETTHTTVDRTEKN